MTFFWGDSCLCRDSDSGRRRKTEIVLAASAGLGSIWSKIIIIRRMNKESKENFDGK